jgi:hypothetical protein
MTEKNFTLYTHDIKLNADFDAICHMTLNFQSSDDINIKLAFGSHAHDPHVHMTICRRKNHKNLIMFYAEMIDWHEGDPDKGEIYGHYVAWTRCAKMIIKQPVTIEEMLCEHVQVPMIWNTNIEGNFDFTYGYDPGWYQNPETQDWQWVPCGNADTIDFYPESVPKEYQLAIENFDPETNIMPT